MASISSPANMLGHWLMSLLLAIVVAPNVAPTP